MISENIKRKWPLTAVHSVLRVRIERNTRFFIHKNYINQIWASGLPSLFQTGIGEIWKSGDDVILKCFSLHTESFPVEYTEYGKPIFTDFYKNLSQKWGWRFL